MGARRRSTSRRLAASAAVLALLATSLGLVATVAAPAAAASAVVVSPGSGVSGGDVITIDASGFVPGEAAGWCQTSALVVVDGTTDGCGANTSYGRVVGPDGSFSGEARAERFIYIPAFDRWVDCADPAEQCGIGVAAVDRIADSAAFALIGFAPAPPPPATRGSVVVAPDEQVAGGTVTVTGSGFRPDVWFTVSQCAPGATDQTTCGYPKVWWLRTDATGGFEVPVTVGTTVDPLDALGPVPTTCTVAAPRCVIAVAEAADVPGTIVTAPVGVVPGVVAVSPSSALVAGSPDLAVTGSSFPPGAEIGVCLGIEPSGPLRWWELGSDSVTESRMGFCGTALEFDRTFTIASTAADGTFAVGGLRLERYVHVYGENRLVDCADPAETCLVHVFATDDVQGTLTSVALDIAPPPPPPSTRGTIEVTPMAGLSNGQVITVDGAGFRAAARIDLYRCEAGVTAREHCERLATSTGQPASVFADGTGVVPTTAVRLPVGSVISSFPQPGSYDCKVDPCVIVAAEAVDLVGTAAAAPIGYRLPRVVPGSVTLTEGDAGSTVASIPVTLSAPWPAEVTADWVAAVGSGVVPPGLAEPGVDFAPAGGTVTFAPGDTSAVVEVTVFGDLVDEPDEYVVLAFGNATNAQIGGFWGLGFARVVDDDPQPVVIPGSVTVTEGDAGSSVASIPVTLSGPSAETVTADWVTVFAPGVGPSAAAEPGVDFAAAGGTVTFAPGDTSAVVEVTVFGDVVDESDEYVVVAFGNPTHARMGGFWGLGFAILADDD